MKHASRHTFSEVLYVLPVYREYTRALTLKNSTPPARDRRQALSIIVVVEIFKLALCISEILIRTRGVQGLATVISEDVLSKPAETAMMMVPCFLYFIQNNFAIGSGELRPSRILRCFAAQDTLYHSFLDHNSQEDHIRQRLVAKKV
jgi:hypothetical protein